MVTASFNYCFHNLTSSIVSSAELSLLDLGLKFVPTNFGPAVTDLNRSLSEFNRRIYLRDYFALKRAAGELPDRDPPPHSRLRVRNPD